MYTFFHGWRRKSGCVSLVMALLFMSLWIKCRFVVDTITFIDNQGVRHTFTNSLNSF
jgi:hypothetical protein